MTKEVLKLALEALETNNKAWKHLADSGDAGFWEAEEQPFYEMSVKAIATIKEALANDTSQERVDETSESVHEPVETIDSLEQEIYENTRQFVSRDVMEWMLKRYYTAPPQRTWVNATTWRGLTEQEQGAIMEDLNAYGTNLYQFARAIEAKLKEKNT